MSRHIGVGDPARRIGPSYLVWGLAGDTGTFLVVPHLLKVDVPDPVAEEGPVKAKSTEGSDDEDREQRPYRCSVHAFDGSPPDRHSLQVLRSRFGEAAELRRRDVYSLHRLVTRLVTFAERTHCRWHA